ncbi:MAG TPA: FAD-binding oxidoreductase [Candidatus Nitrosopolaris sp.]|nr:FAD-binding oxidoreductase [Candidatus Nitrosopolaris sp.]
MAESVADELRRIAKGEVFDDSWSREIYSVDASHYSLLPLAVVKPMDKYDIQEICQYNFTKNLPITGRGGGTGLLGQSLSNGVVVDFTKHMNQIIEVEDDYVVVEPGAVKSVLDRELRRRGKFLPPDPASSNYCTIGGMIANNSSGPHGLGYGSTIDFLEAVNVVYADGSFGFLSEKNSCEEKTTHLRELLSPHLNVIQRGYPQVTKNSCGYRLDAVLNDRGFYPHKLLAGSEGTLGLVTSAQFKILDIPLYRNMLALAFEDLITATIVLPNILSFSPTAVEMLDQTSIDRQNNAATRPAGCLLFVEFANDDLSDVERRLSLCKDKVAINCTAVETANDQISMDKIWAARKGALNNIMRITVGSRRPVGLIEDTVVKTSFLPEYVRFLQKMYLENKLDYVMYGHLGEGNLHTRPIIDINSPKELQLIESLADRVFNKVIKNGGTISGEHGDGLARVGYISRVYGEVIFAIFLQIKQLFDPTYLMNPGKKIAKSRKKSRHQKTKFDK